MKILVIGHSPGSKITNKAAVSPTIKRLNKWLDECNVDKYSFANLSPYHTNNLKKSDVDESYVKTITDTYNKIIALGGVVSQHLSKMNIQHYSAPHPSPLNRKFNDKSFEPKLISSLQNYIYSV